MGRVVSRIEIDRDAPRPAVQPTLVSVHEADGEFPSHRVELGAAHAVLKSRDRRLRRQRQALDRIAIEQQLLDRIVGQPVRVVGVGIPARDPEDTLRHELVHGVRDLGRGPAVGETRGQGRGQAESGVRRFQQNRAAIRARMGLIERRHQGPVEQIRKQHSLWYRFVAQLQAPPS